MDAPGNGDDVIEADLARESGDERVVDLTDSGPLVRPGPGRVTDQEPSANIEGDVEPRPMPRPMQGRVAVVTGAGSGHGRAIALALVEAGARVCALGPDVEALRETVGAAGHLAPALFLRCDLGSVGEIEAAADFVSRIDRPLDVLVHAADVHVHHDVASGPVDDLDEQYLVNVRGPYLLTQKLLPLLVAAPGDVVFVHSREAGGPRAGDTQFAMTSGAVTALADGLRREIEGTAMRVTTLFSGADVSGSTVEDADDEWTAQPKGVVTVDDLAHAVIGIISLPDAVEPTVARVRAGSGTVR